MKRIKLAYEHLAEKNQVYQEKPLRKCRCGYSAVMLWDLERHQRSGYTKYYDRAGFSCNRSIWCCYCDDDIPYRVNQFARHMLKTHNVAARILFPVVNPCPFCSYSRHANEKTTMEHILACQKRFNPNYNLCYPCSSYDLPLLSNSTQPGYNTFVPQNAMHAGSSVHAGNRSAVSNAAASVAVPSVVLGTVGPVVSPPVPIALFTGVMGRAVTAAARNMLPYPVSVGSHMSGIASQVLTASRISAPACMPVVPVTIFNSGIGPQSSVSGVSSPLYTFRMQKPNIYGSHCYQALQNYCQSMPHGRMPFPPLTPSGSVQQPAFVDSAGVTRNNTPNTSLQNSFASASDQTPTSVSGKSLANPRAKIAGNIYGSCGTSPKKPNAGGSSAQSPIVALRRLSVSACEVCGLVFDKRDLMCRHLQDAHSIAVAAKDFDEGSPAKSQQCVCCPLKFFSEQGLDRHMRIIHRIVLSVGKTCPRCSETGIPDLFEHFRFKHNVSVKAIVQWRVCYVCKLNFSTVKDVEHHVLSAHKDLFPTRLHFREAVHAALRGTNRTTSQTQSNLPVNVGQNSIACSHHPQPAVDMNRKRHHSVIEIAEDSSCTNSGASMNVQTAGKKRKREADNVVDLTCSESDTTLGSRENEPETKKVRKSSVSAETLNCHLSEVQTEQRKALSSRNKARKQHSACALDKGAVLGTVLPITKNDPMVLTPLTKERKRKSDSNSAYKPAVAPNVSVHFIPLSSVGDADSSIGPDVSIRIKPLESLDIDESSAEKGKGRSEHDTDSGKQTESRKSYGNSTSKPSDISDISIRIEPLRSLRIEDSSVDKAKVKSVHSADSTVIQSSKGSRKSSGNVTSKPTDVSDVSIRIEPLSSLSIEKSSLDKAKARSVHSADSTVVQSSEGSRKSSSNGTSKPTDVSDVSIRIEPLSSLSIEESSVKKDKSRSVHDARSSVVQSSKKSRKSSGDSTSKPPGISDVSIHIKPLNSFPTGESSAEKDKGQSVHVGDSSIIPPSRTSGSSTSKPARVSDVSVHIKPADSLGTEESLVEEDKGRYKYVHLICSW